MCGRFVGFSTAEQIGRHFGIDRFRAEEIRPNYNVAPMQRIAAVFQEGQERILEQMHWGLVPFWARDLSMGARMINARSETAAEKPSFKAAFRKRRCLIVNDGFFEWKGPAGKKQPMFIRPEGEEGPFGFAGLWETWVPKEGRDAEPYRSCTILTAEASASIRPIHPRMPIVLKPEAYDRWLDPGEGDPDTLNGILAESLYRQFESRPVSTEVNSPLKNGPSLIEKI